MLYVIGFNPKAGLIKRRTKGETRGRNRSTKQKETNMEKATYWNGNGKHQELYNAQWDELVPDLGKAGSLQGETLRAASRLYYRWFNDGDRIVNHGTRPESSAECAWGFLHKAHTLLTGNEGRDALKAIADMAADAALARTDNEYERVLERIADAATLYAATRPLLTTDADMCDRKWDDHCVEACDLHEYEDEDYEDEDYEDEDYEDEE